MTDKEKKMKMELLTKMLQQYGISTRDDLMQALNESPEINITPFVVQCQEIDKAV